MIFCRVCHTQILIGGMVILEDEVWCLACFSESVVDVHKMDKEVEELDDETLAEFHAVVG